MKEMDLMQAIGNVSEDYLEELEAPVRPVHGRRILWKVALAAAIISLFTMTAIAAPAIIRGLREGEVNRGTNIPYLSLCHRYGDREVAYGYEVELQVEADPDAPYTLEEARLPRYLLDNYQAIYCVEHVNGISYLCVYYSPEGGSSRVEFKQYVLPEERSGTYRMAGGFYHSNVEKEMITVGDQEVLDVRYTPFVVSGNSEQRALREFYWSDGQYIYKLEVDPDVPAEFYEAVISSVETVENLEDYLRGNAHDHPNDCVPGQDGSPMEAEKD